MHHYMQPFCAFHANIQVSMNVLLPTCITKAESSINCMVSYDPIRRNIDNRKMEYTHPPLETVIFSLSVLENIPTVISQDEDNLPYYPRGEPKSIPE